MSRNVSILRVYLPAAALLLGLLVQLAAGTGIMVCVHADGAIVIDCVGSACCAEAIEGPGDPLAVDVAAPDSCPGCADLSFGGSAWLGVARGLSSVHSVQRLVGSDLAGEFTSPGMPLDPQLCLLRLAGLAPPRPSLAPMRSLSLRI